MTYRVVIVQTAKDQIASITDTRVRAKIGERIKDLAENPAQQGKPLHGELQGFRSIRAVGQRYRIVYQVQEAEVIVYVINVGLRRAGDKTDAYEQAEQRQRKRRKS